MRGDKRDQSTTLAKIDRRDIDDLEYDEVTDVFDIVSVRMRAHGDHTCQVVGEAARLVKALAGT